MRFVVSSVLFLRQLLLCVCVCLRKEKDTKKKWASFAFDAAKIKHWKEATTTTTTHKQIGENRPYNITIVKLTNVNRLSDCVKWSIVLECAFTFNLCLERCYWMTAAVLTVDASVQRFFFFGFSLPSDIHVTTVYIYLLFFVFFFSFHLIKYSSRWYFWSQMSLKRLNHPFGLLDSAFCSDNTYTHSLSLTLCILDSYHYDQQQQQKKLMKREDTICVCVCVC